MKRANLKHGLLVMCMAALAFAGCKSGDDDDSTNGGTGGMGIGTGGVTGSGGTTGSGGVTGSGGMDVGTGGVTGSGGMTGGTGGVTGTGGMAGGAAGSGVTGEPKFSAIFEEIIKKTGCNGGTLCHAGTVGKLTMLEKDASYMALVGMDAMGTNLPPGGKDCKDSGLKRVVAGDPDHSLLVLKIEGMPPCGNPMPPNGGSMLSADQITQIRTWIQDGAMND
jgi:hypothetical protein